MKQWTCQPHNTNTRLWAAEAARSNVHACLQTVSRWPHRPVSWILQLLLQQLIPHPCQHSNGLERSCPEAAAAAAAAAAGLEPTHGTHLKGMNLSRSCSAFAKASLIRPVRSCTNCTH